MTNEIVFAGFGGQGILLIGRLLTYAGMLAGKEVSWLPAYGPEMRGGTASCSVIISEEAVGSPIVARPSALVAMNKPSLDRFAPAVQAGGTIIINQSLIETTVDRADVKAYAVPLNDLAQECGNARFANMIALGALIGATGMVSLDSIQSAFAKNFAKKPEMIELNMQAVLRGVKFAQQGK